MWHKQLHTLLAVFLILLVFIFLFLSCFSYSLHLFNNLYIMLLLNLPARARVLYDKLFHSFETFSNFVQLTVDLLTFRTVYNVLVYVCLF